METIIIRRSRKAIRTYLLILLILGLPFFCIFLSAYVDPVHNEDRSDSIFYLTLLNLLWIGPFAYLLNKLYNSYKPEIILTKEGIEFIDKKSYNWNDVISYKSQIYTTSGGGDGSEIDLETLFIYFSDRTAKSFRITEFPLDKTAKEIFNLFDQYKMTTGKSERTSWVLKFNESPRYR